MRIVTSPPYGNNAKGENINIDESKRIRKTKGGQMGQSIRNSEGYGQTSGQIGQEKQEDYASAMLAVYSEALKVASVLAVVTKDPTRNKRLYPLGEITQRLLESAGWTILCRHKAMLFSEHEQGDLFNGSRKKVKGRLSFFKRLAYQKGIPIADH